MKPDTIFEILDKKHSLIEMLKNTPDLTNEVADMYLARIDSLNSEINLIKNIK